MNIEMGCWDCACSGELRGAWGVRLRRWKTAPCLHCGLFCCVPGGSAEQLRDKVF